jgi:predicted TIM-barrel fold metal-dependent hydrolase
MKIAPKVIDADSHVYEVEETWSYLPNEYQARRPLPVTLKPDDVPYMMPMNAFWLIDARVVNRTWGRGCVQVGTPLTAVHAQRKAFSPGSQSLMDVDSRLRDLDRAGVDVQIVYPSLCVFVPLTEDDAFESALLGSYNTWIAKRCGERPDRLKWTAALSLRDPAAAAREIRRVKELGAVGVMTGGTSQGTLLNSPELDPVWEAASACDLPVCVHIAWSYPALLESCEEITSSLNLALTLPLLFGAFSFTAGGILDRFPRLRVGFFEGGAGWVPWLIPRLDHYHGLSSYLRTGHGLAPLTSRKPAEYRDRIFVTCEADEPLLPQAVEYLGEDNIMVSEDMPHLEDREGSCAELVARSDISERVKRKIVYDNPVRFYGLG